MKIAPLKKSIYSLCPDLASISRAANDRYIQFLSTIEHLGSVRPSQVSLLLKRLRLHAIVKKIGKTYKYYLTELGRHVAAAGLTLKNLFLVPEFERSTRLLCCFLQSTFRRTDYPSVALE